MVEVLSTKQLVAKAQSAYKDSDFLEAAEIFKAAEESFSLVGDKLSAAEMANNRSVCLLQAGESEIALELLEGKDEIFESAGDFLRQAMTLGNRAAVFEALHSFDEAQKVYQKSADLFKQIGESELYSATMQSLSALQLRTGRSLEALSTMQAGLDKIARPNFKQRMIKRLLDIPYQLMNR